MIKLQLDDARLGEPSDIHFVLTGGASNLPGLARLIERTPDFREGITMHNNKKPLLIASAAVLAALAAITSSSTMTLDVETSRAIITSNSRIPSASTGATSLYPQNAHWFPNS